MNAGLKDVVHFEGSAVDELAAAFRDSIDDYLAFCAERSEKPECRVEDLRPDLKS